MRSIGIVRLATLAIVVASVSSLVGVVLTATAPASPSPVTRTASSALPASAALATTPAPPSPATRATPPPARWVAVSVATLWVAPGQARPVDALAGANPADPRGWVVGMTLAQKRWLVGRLETQALYGTKVYLLETSGKWSKVAVTGQPTPRCRWGYPGWLPTVQLTEVAPATTPQSAPRMAVVRRRTAWLWETAALSAQVLELSYDTRLPAVAWTADAVEVVMLDGRHVFVRRSSVALHEPGTAWPPLTGAKLVAEAKRFAGLQYLWAGTSGYGFDCSGLTWAIHRALGTTIPRDAGAQSARGTRIGRRSSLRPGDLVFFKNASGSVHHVGLYVGGGMMIHAPATGQAVRTTSIYAAPYASEFAGGRRYAP
jgi:gamma-D-glutamyl-L-lysine dipeptidyl-peptidase